MTETVTLTRAEHEALLNRIEELEDLVAAKRALDALASGAEEAVPVAVVKRLIAGEHPLRVWREYRDLGVRELARQAGTSASYGSAIERGGKQGSADVLRRMAGVLRVTMDDLMPARPVAD